MRTLPPKTFQRLIREPVVQLLDVRMPHEVELVSLPGALNIPVHELPHRLAEMATDRPVAIYCHHGVRSEHAALLLEQQGFADVSHLEGGIEAWTDEIDPTLPRY
ncbi:MAG: rhodanese-like domain-containing protein [Panacagrimonas sp.]